jgi:O-antigen/teichoic acid export membrane protein
MNKLKSIKNYLKSDFILKILESFVGRASYIIFTLFFSFVCTRLYGPELFGRYTYAFTIISLLMILAKAGLDNGIIYSIPKNNNKHISLSLAVNFIFSVLLILAGLLFIKDDVVRVMLPLVWLVSAEQIFFGIYRSKGKIKEYYFINGFISMLLRILLLTSLYFLLGKNIFGIVIAVYISFILSLTIYFKQNISSISKLIFDKEYLKYSFPLTLATIMAVVIDKIDIIMLGQMATNKEVGIYQITVQVANLISIMLLIFNTVFAPKISKLYHSNKLDDLRRIYISSTRVLGLIGVIFIFLIICFGNYFLIFFGPEIAQGQTSLTLRGIGQFVNVAVGSVWLMLSMTGKPKLQMYANLIACLLNVILNFILIPKYGINGAAFASMISIVFTNIIGYILVSKRFQVKVFKIV